MKNKLIIIALAFSLLLWQCTSGDVAPSVTQPVSVAPEVAGRTTDFAFDFFKEVTAAEPASDNVFVSPLGLHMALGMLLNGADGETASQIVETLRTKGISLADLNAAYQSLIDGLPQADSRVMLGLANSMWYRQGFKVEDDFTNVLKQSFQAETNSLDFSSPKALERINGWASDKTNGKVKKVLDVIDPATVVILMNALYFKGDWQTQFDAKQTTDAPFYLANGEEKNVKMMRTKSDFEGVSGGNFSALRLPYASGQFNMTLLLPDQGSSVGEVIEGLDANAWNSLNGDLRKSGYEVGLPRFKLDYEVELNEVLRAMGMPIAFTGAADLTKINRAGGLYVSLVKQNSYLGIDEKGTEAAAVTTILIEKTSVGTPVTPKFICDRPFVLVISERTSNTILFMGKIMNP